MLRRRYIGAHLLTDAHRQAVSVTGTRRTLIPALDAPPQGKVSPPNKLPCQDAPPKKPPVIDPRLRISVSKVLPHISSLLAAPMTFLPVSWPSSASASSSDGDAAAELGAILIYT